MKNIVKRTRYFSSLAFLGLFLGLIGCPAPVNELRTVDKVSVPLQIYEVPEDLRGLTAVVNILGFSEDEEVKKYLSKVTKSENGTFFRHVPGTSGKEHSSRIAKLPKELRLPAGPEVTITYVFIGPDRYLYKRTADNIDLGRVRDKYYNFLVYLGKPSP